MVESNGLENRSLFTRTRGSNPLASAHTIKQKSPLGLFYFILFCVCGMFWTKFETISSKIQMIKMNSVGRNNLSGGKDSPCLGCFPARRRGLGRNAGGFRTGGFEFQKFATKILQLQNIFF